MFRTTQAAFHASTCAQQADPDCRFRPAVLPRDLLNLVAFNIVSFKHHSVVGLAVIQNALDIDRGYVHAWRRL